VFVTRTISVLLRKSPRQQLVDTVDLVIGDTTEDIGQPRLRIDAVEFGCLNQRVGNGDSFSAAVVSLKSLNPHDLNVTRASGPNALKVALTSPASNRAGVCVNDYACGGVGDNCEITIR